MENIVSLSQKNLSRITEQIKIPSYDRSSLMYGMLHVGVGGFHRAHQAYYTNLLQEKYYDPEWGICGVGLRKADRKIYAVLKKQDNLYTLVIKHPDGKIEPQIIGSIIDFELGFDEPELLLERMSHPKTKIVSLTITEGGYNFNPATGEFDFDNPDIQHELRQHDSPKTIYGFLAASLRKRRNEGLPAFTIMSCDNIEHNGDITRKMLLSFVYRQDPDLAEWIQKEVCFPNSMVDRITPVTTLEDISDLEKNYGIKDEWPVTCEPFMQWVVEDKFSNGRPAFEKVGVQFVPDVKPYEKMKLRLLNAGHSVLGILGAIHGYKTINDCMQDELFVNYLRIFMDKEATPVLDEVAGIDLVQYKDHLEERFANPNIKDNVSRICSESSAKLPKFLIPTILENLDCKGSIEFATLVIAAWCYYCDKGLDKNGFPIEKIDVMNTELHQAAKLSKTNPLSFIQLESIFGNIAQNKSFVSLYIDALDRIYKDADIRKHMKHMLQS